MARIRTVKPGFFKNEILADLPMASRLLFIGLWTLADCEGRLEDRPKRIKAEIFPYDNVDVTDLISRLQSAGFIIRYTASGGNDTESEVGEMKVIQVVNFKVHQRITGSEADSESDYPAPDKGLIEETTRKQLGSTKETPRTTGKEGKGKEGKRKGKEREFSPPSIDEFKKYFIENGFSEKLAERAWKGYSAAEWHDTKGNKILNWKQKCQNVWFKPEDQKEKSSAKKEKGNGELLFEQHERFTEANKQQYGGGPDDTFTILDPY